MIVDSSALVAVLAREPGYERLLDAMLANVGRLRMASANYLEAAIVLDGRRDPIVSRSLDSLIAELEITIEAFTADDAIVAREAYRDFGRGSCNPAKLNFGDAIAYATARSRNAPLLFVGNDFGHTDIEAAIEPV